MPALEVASEYPDLNWVIMKNKLYDTSHIIHPGGNFMFKHVRGLYFTC